MSSVTLAADYRAACDACQTYQAAEAARGTTSAVLPCGSHGAMTWTKPPRRRIMASTMSPLLTTLLQALPGFSASDPLPAVQIAQVTADSRPVRPDGH